MFHAIENASLIAELSKIPYPMDSYVEFSIAWPHTPDQIQQVHQSIFLLSQALKK